MKSTSLIPQANSHIWSLADQALVSGSNFMIGVVLARSLGVEAFGAYVVAQMYLLYANTFQASLVVSPMMTAVPAGQTAAIQATMIRGFLGFTLLVMLFTGVSVQALAWLLGHISPHLGIGKLAFSLAAAMGAFQLQDWLRRALYVESDNRKVFLVDLIAYGGQLAVLLFISFQLEMRPETALWVLAGCFSLAALPVLAHAKLWPDFASTRQIIGANWRSSRDLFATWQLQWLGSQGVILLGTGMVGPQAAGAIRAAQNLFGPVNVLFQWMDNVVPVRAALQLKSWGRAGLVAYLGRIAWIGILMLSLFTLVLLVVDEPLITFLYGETFRPFAILVVFQALYYLFGHGYRMVNYFHRALGSTGVLAHSSLWWAIAAVAFALLTVNWLAERGIMLSLVAGEVTALAYLLLLRPSSGDAGQSPNKRGKPHHLVLRRSDGSPHLLLPLANKPLMNSALHLYSPSRWTGRLYRRSLEWSLPWRARLGWVEAEPSFAAWCPNLPVILESVPGASPERVGILVAAPGPRSKLTLKLMNESGDALAYARVATLPDAVSALRQEYLVLAEVGKSPSREKIPLVLGHGDFPDNSGYFLVVSACQEGIPEKTLIAAHFSFLAGLMSEKSATWAAVVDRLEAETKPLLANAGYAGLIASILPDLRAKEVPALPVTVEHGDFAPWNIHLNAESRLFVFDWEHARLESLPWLDALHFVYQMEVLVRRRNASQVLTSLRAVFRSAAAEEYLNRLPEVVAFEDQIIAVYLLRKLAVGVSEGYEPASRQQIMCCLILEYVLGR